MDGERRQNKAILSSVGEHEFTAVMIVMIISGARAISCEFEKRNREFGERRDGERKGLVLGFLYFRVILMIFFCEERMVCFGYVTIFECCCLAFMRYARQLPNLAFMRYARQCTVS